MRTEVILSSRPKLQPEPYLRRHPRRRSATSNLFTAQIDYTFARVNAVLQMKVRDYSCRAVRLATEIRPLGWVRLHPKRWQGA
jgi:hypothetical protein